MKNLTKVEIEIGPFLHSVLQKMTSDAAEATLKEFAKNMDKIHGKCDGPYGKCPCGCGKLLTEPHI